MAKNIYVSGGKGGFGIFFFMIENNNGIIFLFDKFLPVLAAESVYSAKLTGADDRFFFLEYYARVYATTMINYT